MSSNKVNATASVTVASANLAVQEGSRLIISETSLIDDAGITGNVAPLTVSSIDGSASMGFISVDPVAATVVYTARGYQPGAAADSFAYTVTDGVTTWNETATVTVTTTHPDLTTVVAAPGAATMQAQGYNQRLIMNNAPTATLSGAQGNDLVFAGNGADTITLSGYNNVVYGGAGGDTIFAGQGNESVIGGDGDNLIVASGYNNTLSAGNGNNVVLGPQGNTTVSLGNGSQTVVLAGYGNTVSVGDGGSAGMLGAVSYINTGDGSATVTAGDGTNIVIAGGYNNHITVGNGTNLIFTTDKSGGLAAPAGLPAGYTQTQPSLGDATVSLGDGNDWLYLNGYNNTVNVGSGMDAIWGGTGNDSFVLNAGGGNLFVQNFSITNGDTLDLSKILAGVSLKSDLTNLSSFVKVVGHGLDDAAFGIGSDGGINTQLQVTGAGGTAMVNLENTGSLSLGDLMSHHSLVVGH